MFGIMLIVRKSSARTGIRTPVIGLEGRDDIQTTLYGQTHRARISSISITVALHICDSELVCELLSASTHNHNACRTTILPSQNQDILLVSLEASANLKLKHPVRFHQQHHATLSNDLARLKHESIHEQEYAAIALSLPSILDGGQS